MPKNDDMAWLEANKDKFAEWDAHQVASYMRGKADLGAYYEVILEHKVTGQVAPRLTDNDLKEMGITSIGDRKRFGLALDELKKVHRKQEREKVLWTGEEQLYHGCWDGFCGTCCTLSSDAA
jgi:squalene cyclase